MKKLTVALSVQELQTVLQALGNLPYIQVHELIGTLQQQATPQLQSTQEVQKKDAYSPEKDNRKTGQTA